MAELKIKEDAEKGD
jgi:hypothetical protein